MMTKRQYVEFLLSTANNYTCTYRAEHLEDVSHDQVIDFLQGEHLTAAQLWELVQTRIQDGPDACLILDDSVHDKRYSHFIELVKRQYSGSDHQLVRGIGVVTLVHSAGHEADFYPIDYRIDAPDQDGKTKNEHFRAMLIRAISEKQIRAQTVLFDSWYASVDNLKLIHRLGLTFFTTLKSNRLVSLSKEAGYVHLDAIDWTPERLARGVRVKLTAVPFHVQLFKVVAPNGDIDWVMTNDADETRTTQVVQDVQDVRWQVEELHRGLKQLTGSQDCQCRSARAQRNHLACCYHAWVSLKVKARQLGTTVYQVRAMLFREYLRAELRQPRVPAV